MRRYRRLIPVAIVLPCLAMLAPAAVAGQTPPTRTGKQVYDSICVTCHGPDGKAGVNLELEKTVVPPDFADCAFAAREPDRGFLAVAHGGGPARGFSPLMPPLGAAFTEAELASAIGHLRTFCTDQSWPRGELNLPRPFVTAKAFPEDEAVLSMAAKSGSVVTKAIYERRFGSQNQFEIIVPVSSVESGGVRSAGLGDIALEYKRVLAHSLTRGNIVSATAEFVLPTGDSDKSLGGGVGVFEPFATFGQVIGESGFLQAQAGLALPMKSGHANEAFWRVAIGRTFEQTRFGRNWAPMVELLSARAFEDGAKVEFDVLPGVQVTLNRRQHVRLAGGLRLPVTEADERRKTVMIYLLWDWYEGGFGQGW